MNFFRNSLTEISTPIDISQTNDEDKTSTIETISQVFILHFSGKINRSILVNIR